MLAAVCHSISIAYETELNLETFEENLDIFALNLDKSAGNLETHMAESLLVCIFSVTILRCHYKNNMAEMRKIGTLSAKKWTLFTFLWTHLRKIGHSKLVDN